jgi:hypothetical protein
MSELELNGGVAFAFTVVAGRTQVYARFLSGGEIRRQRRTRVFVVLTDAEIGSEEDKASKAYNRAELRAIRRKLEGASAALAAGGYIRQPGGGSDVFGYIRQPGGGSYVFGPAGYGCEGSPEYVFTGQVTADRSLGERWGMAAPRSEMSRTLVSDPVEVWIW